MSLPTADMITGISDLCLAHKIEQLITTSRPDLAELTEVDDAHAWVRMRLTGGRSIICGRLRDNALTAWTVMTPDLTDAPTFGRADESAESLARRVIREHDRLTAAPER
ncbi:hypothetical protein [Flexivirga oryzae]|uniref:Uncharacterized protein n=1 Tax=Flexivirga oryzae TaxID=1794944 RepID=A0A839NE22_9MICO|nr:hypothetical protein [Flexivirga oryzae]MBB2893876.1 hypothetical protein [Flexivirga oryzae]